MSLQHSLPNWTRPKILFLATHNDAYCHIRHYAKSASGLILNSAWCLNFRDRVPRRANLPFVRWRQRITEHPNTRPAHHGYWPSKRWLNRGLRLALYPLAPRRELRVNVPPYFLHRSGVLRVAVCFAKRYCCGGNTLTGQCGKRMWTAQVKPYRICPALLLRRDYQHHLPR